MLILRQTELDRMIGNWSSVLMQYALLNDVKTKPVSMNTIEKHKDLLTDADTLPFGSVEFLQKAMRLAGIQEPENISYPESLSEFLHREVSKVPVSEITGTCFVKPVRTKGFTGIVFDEGKMNSETPEYREFCAFKKKNKSELVWKSQVVYWQSEYRYYVLGAEILGWGRYDSKHDGAPEPELAVVRQMVSVFHASGQAPTAYSLDVGVLSSGRTALIEANDAWALGYYKGNLTGKDYVNMHHERWKELVTKQKVK